MTDDPGTPPPVTGSSVFISYAHADRALVDRLVADLRAYNITCWIDKQNLKPGTLSWERALRTAIRAASGVVLICSPSALASRFVPDELRIAEMYERMVYPLWVAGEQWMDSVPMGWGGVQMLDARGDHYPQALAALIAEIGTQVAAALPESHVQPRATAVMSPPRNPYKGLRPFRGTDAGDFFGRERMLQDLLEALHATLQGGPRYLAVVGPSGSGKSSTVLAGLLPQLQTGALAGSDGWHYLAPLVPGAHPLEALTVALAEALPGSSLSAIRTDLDASSRGLHLLALRLAQRSGQRVVLVIDQFEELFTLTTDSAERQQVIDLLVTAVREPGGPLLAVLTLRADFYDRPMTYPELVTLMDTHSKLIPPLDLEDLRAAITRPAALPDVQVHFEGDLVGDLLFEVRGQPGALPLLQFTLDQLFEHREGRLLTLDAYRQLGGVRGALSRQAEATYGGLPTDEHRLLARALLLRLIEPGASEQEATRRRAPLQELALADARQAAVMQEVIARFVEARLLSTDQLAGLRTIEVSHEALIREWPRLFGWLHEAREDIRLQQALSEDAAAWLRHGRSADYLYRGTLLAEAQDWLGRNVANADEQAFVAASLAEGAREAALAQEQQARELALAQQAAVASRRAARRLRSLVGVLGVFLLVAALLSALALQQQSRATANEHAAVAAQATAVAQRDAAISSQLTQESDNLLGSHYDLALLLGLQALRFHNTQAASGAVLSALMQPVGLLTTLSGNIRPVESVAFSPEGALLASGSGDGTIRLWDTANWRQIGQLFTGHDTTVFSVAFSPDGSLLASGSWNDTIRLWDVATRRQMGLPLTEHSSAVNRYSPIASVAFSPRGNMLASSSTDGIVRLWDVATRLQIGQLLASQSGTFGSLAFSPDGTLLATGSENGTVRLWNMATDHLVGQVLAGSDGPTSGVTFSPRGTTLATYSEDGAIWLWDVASRRPLTKINGQFGTVTSVAFSPDGTVLAAGDSSTLRVWELKSGQRVSPPFTGALGRIDTVAFSPNGKLLAASSDDGAVWLWDAASRRQIGRIRNGYGYNLPETGADIAFSPNGTLLAVDSPGTIELWDLASRRQIGRPLTYAGFSDSIAFSQDGRLLASGSADGTVRLWDVASRRPVGQPLTGHTGPVNSLAFSPDGRVLASGSADATIRLWAVPTLRQIGQPLVGAIGAVNSVAFSPNGALLAAGSQDGSIMLWNVATRHQFGQALTGHTAGVTSVAFSPDGTLLASAGQDRTIRLWDVAGDSELGDPIAGLPAIVVSLVFSPDGTVLASGSADPEPTVRLWPTALRDLQAHACALAGRNLTRQEWQEYLGTLPYEKTCPAWP